MKLTVNEARSLAVSALKGIAYDEEAATVTADHLVDAALRGYTFGSLARILALAENLDEFGDKRQPIKTLRETPVSALLDGGDNVGYFVAYRATKLAIEKAKRSGIAIVGARNTYYTGLFTYYMEMATREGLVAFAAGNGPAVVAPDGALDARLGTNPIAFGFPSSSDPVIWDIGTCAIMHGEVLLHKRLGELLPEGVAIDKTGAPTRDPAEALAGAIRTWGGHRGSGLSMVVQLLGAICGGPVISPGMHDMAYLVVVIDPALLLPDGDYPDRVAELSQAIRSARPIDPANPVRMPFDRSRTERARRLKEDAIEVPDRVHQQLVKLAQRRR